MKFSLKVISALQIVFAWPEVINRAYFFVFIPFFCSLLLLFSQGMNLLSLLILLIVLIISFIYQLYLWSVAFFYAQQISEYDWSEYGLSLRELFTDWGVKLKLLLIRVAWYLPFVTVLLLILVASGKDIFSLNLNLETAGYLLTLGVIFGVIQTFLEQIPVNLSQYIYAETGSLLRALNPIKVMLLFFQAPLEYLAVFALALLPTVVLGLIITVFQFILALPLIGGLLLGFVLGLNTLYTVMFLPNLQGQIWGRLRNK